MYKITSMTKIAVLAGASIIAMSAINIGHEAGGQTVLTVGTFTQAMAAESGGNPDKGKQQKGSPGAGKGQGSGQGQGISGGVPRGPSSAVSSEDDDGDDGDDAKGPKYKGGGEHGNEASGTRPPWAQEGIPSVELGRLNVAKAPSHVLLRALEEIYLNNLDKNEDGILDEDADTSVIDSPIANLALLQEALAGQRQVDGTWTLLEASVFLGVASDKYIPVSEETVIAIATILGYPEYDYSSFSYDRSTVYSDEFADVFSSEAYVGTGLEAFAQAADDARAVIVYYHDL